jgi:hypothetical protein
VPGSSSPAVSQFVHSSFLWQGTETEEKADFMGIFDIVRIF